MITSYLQGGLGNQLFQIAAATSLALENSDALVLMTEWKMFRNPSLSKMKAIMKNLCIFDGRNQYDPVYMRENGFEYKGIGR